MTKPARAISCAAYARLRGVSPEAVRKAIKDCRLSEGHSYVRTASGEIGIFVDNADEEWNSTSQLAGGGEKVHYGLEDSPTPEPESVAARNGRESLAEGREALMRSNVRIKEITAQQRYLELQVKLGSLVSRKTVEKDLSTIGACVRERMRQIPKSVSAELCDVSDVMQIERTLGEAIERALSDLASGIVLEKSFVNGTAN